MQAAKDSFYMTLRSRLAEVNPQRIAVIGGVTRPAIMVVENERVGEDAEMNDAFALRWGAPSAAEAGGALQAMTCTVSFQTEGTEQAAGTDRGRGLATMDHELEQISQPPSADKMDYTQTPPVALGTTVFWSAPVFAGAELDGAVIHRKATMIVYFIPEGA